MEDLHGRLIMTTCRVQYRRMHKGNLCTGQPENTVKSQRPGAHYRVSCESVKKKKKRFCIGRQRICARRLKNLHWKPGETHPKVMVKTGAPPPKKQEFLLLSLFIPSRIQAYWLKTWLKTTWVVQ